MVCSARRFSAWSCHVKLTLHGSAAAVSSLLKARASEGAEEEGLTPEQLAARMRQDGISLELKAPAAAGKSGGRGAASGGRGRGGRSGGASGRGGRSGGASGRGRGRGK